VPLAEILKLTFVCTDAVTDGIRLTTSNFVAEKNRRILRVQTRNEIQSSNDNYSKETSQKQILKKHFSILTHLAAISVGQVLIFFPQERCRIIFRTATIDI
jgi:hypothetical protein